MLLPASPAQYASKAKKSEGPRALGLLQILPNGKAHLIPITIMFKGEFYDASAYKASPVPMALEGGTVYEGVQTGVSQGLFTVTGALHSEDNKTWIGDGTWQDAASLAAAAKKKPVQAKSPGQSEEPRPPRLRRGKPEIPAPTEPPHAPAPPAAASPVTPSAPAAPAPAEPPAAAAPEDPNRPVLRRGKPSVQSSTPVPSGTAPLPKPASRSSAASNSAGAALQAIPAISDAGGPEPRPYSYSTKPEEDQQFRQKMLAMAANELRDHLKEMASATVSAEPAARAPSPRNPATVAKSPQPSFSNVRLRILDLFNNNEPVLVLNATAQLSAKEKSAVAPEYDIALVGREDTYGDMHKIFANTTDTAHLDVVPNMEFIDAVDADGDGHGELLFRLVSKTGNAFALYRVIGNQLWPLFRGTPGQ